MENMDEMKKLISVAFGREVPDRIFTNCKVLNVFTNELETKDIAVCNGRIAGLGDYANSNGAVSLDKETEIVDLHGATVCPGLIDGHIHIESTMLTPIEFAKAVIPHGTTAVITDPHEIANVAGISGIEYMMEQSSGLPLDVFYVLPSCVPATPLDEAGATLNADDLEPLIKRDNVVGLAELMNAFGTVRNDEEILKKINVVKKAGKEIDGHAPGLTGKELNAYVAAGVHSDHECAEYKEALEKLRLGQWIMVREGTAAKNLEHMMPLFDEKYYNRCMLVTDDKHPGDLIEMGHIDYIIRKAVKLGADPAKAIKMASLNAAQHFGLKDKGAIAPGYKADFVVVDSIERFNVLATYYNGRKISEKGLLTEEAMKFFAAKAGISKCSEFTEFEDEFDAESERDETAGLEDEGKEQDEVLATTERTQTDEHAAGESCATMDGADGTDNDEFAEKKTSFETRADFIRRYRRVYESFNLRELSAEDFVIKGEGTRRRIIGLIDGQILTQELFADADTTDDVKNGIVKLAVIERHKDTGHIGLGYMKGYGLKKGAVASSIAHDSHNLIIAGANDEDMALAANTVNANGGGLAIVCDGEVLGTLALPVGGIMCEESAEAVEDRLKMLKKIASALGVSKGIDPFMTLSFSSLSVIPKLKLTTFGLVDCTTQQLVPVLF